jgi:hypothetical protein
MKSEEVVRPPAKTNFKICMELYAIHNVHYQDEGENGSHYINIDWGGKQVQSSGSNLKCGMLEYYKYIELEESFSCNSLTQLPDIIISVVRNSKDRHVSYCRLKPADFASAFEIKDNYYMLNIDRAVCKL